MPYSGPTDPSLPAPVRDMPADKRRQWIAVFNSVYQRCIDAGGDAQSCETKAFPQAYGVVKGGKMADLKTEMLPGIDILRVGEGFQGGGCPDGGCTFTVEDLDGIVTAYWATKDSLQPPMKLGHDENQALLQADGYPATGWVANLRRLGERLYADLVDVPKRLADLIKAGAYRFVSVELDTDMEVEGTKYPYVLTGLALLGADLPAVDGLKGMAALYQSLHLEYDNKGRRVIVQREPVSRVVMRKARMAEWDTAYINDLPDSAFAYITPGGEKDENGRTVPRTNRYLPHHKADGSIDLPHLRNAMSRLPQTTLPAAAKPSAMTHLSGHARSEGMGDMTKGGR